MTTAIAFKDVIITPSTVPTSQEYKIEVEIEYSDPTTPFAFVGGYVGSYVNIMDSEAPGKLPPAHVGDFVKS